MVKQISKDFFIKKNKSIMERIVVHYSPKMITWIICVFIASFISVVIFQNERAKRYIKAENKTRIQRVHISKQAKDGPLRAAIFYAQDSFLTSYLPLIGDYKSHDIWDFQVTSQYELANLAFPYELSKEENSDTVIVYKDRYILKFLLVD